MRRKIRNKFSLTHLLVLAAAATSCPPAPAAAAPCLTHNEARAKWPDDHLWWHTDARCFDNHRRAADHYDVPDKAVVVDHVDQAVATRHTTVYYPTMEINAWPERLLPLDAHDMSSWPVLFDVDAPTKFTPWGDRVKGAWRK